ILYSVVVLLFFAMSCDKTAVATRKFLKAGEWNTTQLTAGTITFDKLPRWEIQDCENHENFCQGVWHHPNGSKTLFYWKFSNIGGTFGYYADPQEIETGSMAYSQCLNFSGEYKIIKSKKKLFHFESEETLGYPGKLVTIIIER